MRSAVRNDPTRRSNFSELPPFWAGFELPGCPDLTAKSVLEIGCGEGRRCFELAAHGAARIVGLDPNGGSIASARRRLQNLKSSCGDRLVFCEGELGSFAPEKFDVIVSENALEHVVNVPELLADIRHHLNPGGQVYLGFGPLYDAPEGDHGWLRAVLPGRRFFWWPWGHLLFERYALRKLGSLYGHSITLTENWPFLYLNRHTVEEFECMIRSCGLRITYLRRNYVKSLQGRLFAATGRLPCLARYFTLNLFVILEAGPAPNRA
jgi:SAM-dependent methyltransferase